MVDYVRVLILNRIPLTICARIVDQNFALQWVQTHVRHNDYDTSTTVDVTSHLYSQISYVQYHSYKLCTEAFLQAVWRRSLKGYHMGGERYVDFSAIVFECICMRCEC